MSDIVGILAFQGFGVGPESALATESHHGHQTVLHGAEENESSILPGDRGVRAHGDHHVAAVLALAAKLGRALDLEAHREVALEAADALFVRNLDDLRLPEFGDLGLGEILGDFVHDDTHWLPRALIVFDGSECQVPLLGLGSHFPKYSIDEPRFPIDLVDSGVFSIEVEENPIDVATLAVGLADEETTIPLIDQNIGNR